MSLALGVTAGACVAAPEAPRASEWSYSDRGFDAWPKEELAVRSRSVPELLACVSRADVRSASAAEPSDAPFTSQAASNELRRRARAGRLADEEWRAALRACDVVHTRACWPAGETLQAWIRIPSWLSSTRIAIRAVDPASGFAVVDHARGGFCGQFIEDRERHDRHVEFAPLPMGTKQIVFELVIEEPDESVPRWIATKPWRPLWAGAYSVPIDVAPGTEDVLPLATSPALDRSLRDSCALWWSKPSPEASPLAFLLLDVDLIEHPEPARVAVFADVELRRDGVTVGSAAFEPDQLEFAILGRVEGRPLLYASSFDSCPPELAAEGADLAGWTLVVRGRPGDALALWEAEARWAGQFEIPLAEAIARGRRSR